MISLLAYGLEPYVWEGGAIPAAWGVVLSGAAVLAGTAYLVINGG